eukprot:Lankesteria_metandrocarpae@DN4690_c0_g1_i2.p1
MALVNVTKVEVGRNPAAITDPFQFEVVFECLERLEADLDWKLTYVGSSENKTLDQELDSVVMGPINRGALKFAFEASPPDFTKIPVEDIHGFTIILLTGAYRTEEFIRIGWYIHNDYTDTELQMDPPEIPLLHKMHRYVLTDDPRVTRFKISWDNPRAAPVATSCTLTEQEANEDAIEESLRTALSLGITCTNPSSGVGQLMDDTGTRLGQRIDAGVGEAAVPVDGGVPGTGSAFGFGVPGYEEQLFNGGCVLVNSCGADVGGGAMWGGGGGLAAGVVGPVTGDVDMQ